MFCYGKQFYKASEVQQFGCGIAIFFRGQRLDLRISAYICMLLYEV